MQGITIITCYMQYKEQYCDYSALLLSHCNSFSSHMNTVFVIFISLRLQGDVAVGAPGCQAWTGKWGVVRVKLW